MKSYFNHRAALIEVVLRFGFTDDILRSADFAQFEGVELRGAVPDPNEGCLMPPAGDTIVIDIPEAELLPYEVLAEGWQADGFRHAGFGYREFVVPARIVNRYDRSLYAEDDEAGRGQAGHPEDEPWTHTPDRAVWRAYKRGLVLTVTRLAGGSWQATVEGPSVTERSPMPFRTRKRAQAWADNRAGGAS